MITTIAGPNNYLLRQALSKIVDDFALEHGDLSIEKVDGEEAEFGRITEAMQSLPFLASKKLVVLSAPSAHKNFTEQFEELLEAVPESNDIVIVEPKLDKRLSYFKLLKSKTQFMEFTELDAYKLSDWVVSEVKASGGEISRSDAAYLVDRIGLNQQQLSNEISKLVAYSPQVTKNSIDELTEPSPQGSVFELLDAALGGHSARAIRLYEQQRQQKVEPQMIMGMIAWQLHILALVKSAEKDPQADLNSAGISPFVISKSQGLARSVSMAEVKQMVQNALEADLSIKTKSVDADSVLKNLLISLG